MLLNENLKSDTNPIGCSCVEDERSKLDDNLGCAFVFCFSNIDISMVEKLINYTIKCVFVKS